MLRRPFHALLISLLLLAGLAWPSTALAQRTTITASGTLPTTCRVGDMYRKTGSSAGVYQCSATNTWTLIFDATGVVPPANLGTGSSITTKFLRGDGTWQTLAGGGDLLSTNNLSDVANVGTARTSLGVGTGDSPQFTAVNVGAATDTTLTRVSAGVIAVEGSTVLVSGGALGTPSGGSAANLTALPPAGVTFSATNRLLCRDTASGGAGEECTAAAALAMISATQGDVLYHNGTAWVALAAGTNGHYLQTQGAGANPQWAAGAGGGLASTDIDTSSELKAILGDELGAASGKVIFSEGALAVASGKTLTVSHTMTLAGGDSSVITFPNATATALTTNADVTYAQLTQGSALSVLGVAGNATADVASIAAASDHQVMRRSGTAIAFGAVNLAQSAAVTGTLPEGNGGTGQTTFAAALTAAGVPAFTDPNADRFVFWDDSAGAFAALTMPAAFAISGTTATLTLPVKVQFNAGVCQNATASVGFSTPTTLGAAGGCHSTTAGSGDPAFGFAVFPTGGADTELHGQFELPDDWTGAVDLTLKWNAVSTTANDVVWEVAIGCVATNEAATTISYNDQAFTAVTNLGTTLRFNVASKTGLTMTGCAAGETAYFIIHRDTDTSGDTLDADVNLISATFTLRRGIS